MSTGENNLMISDSHIPICSAVGAVGADQH